MLHFPKSQGGIVINYHYNINSHMTILTHTELILASRQISEHVSVNNYISHQKRVVREQWQLP